MAYLSFFSVGRNTLRQYQPKDQSRHHLNRLVYTPDGILECRQVRLQILNVPLLLFNFTAYNIGFKESGLCRLIKPCASNLHCRQKKR
jgi:hypothetical protein